ncbi:MAG: FliH/SctL family protein [Janthinobacterium lividum]
MPLSSNLGASTLPLEYRDVSFLHGGPTDLERSEPLVPGVPEHEVERRLAIARETATAAVEHRMQAEAAAQQAKARQQLAQTLDAFNRERTAYFSRVETEVVQLALAIARKILQRESELDPTLLGALVRIALDRMQSGTAVRVRVVPAEAELWRTMGSEANGTKRWQVEEDAALMPGDCLVQTEMGEANFGLEAQMCDVEQSFRGLLAHNPGAR